MEKKKEHGLKGKPGNGKNSPVIGNNGLMVEPGDNALYLRQSMELMNLPTIDLHDPDSVKERLGVFFEIMERYDTKPTVAGMALALGIDRRALWAIRNDRPYNGQGWKYSLPRGVSDTIKKAYVLMENLWENYMQNGKINPVSGIFLGKNNFGYQDKTEHIVTPNVKQDSDYDADAIRKRYLIDSGSDTDSDSEE